MKRPVAVLVLSVVAAVLPAATAVARDRDHDRLPDAWEKRHRLSRGIDDSRRDADRDGLSNYGEYRAHTSPRRPDTDRDGTYDADEDRDHDRLDNGGEVDAGTDPARRDSDRDGRSDAREDADRDGLRNREEDDTAHRPRDPDTDDDGIRDGREYAGRITYYDGASIRLTLSSGGYVVARLGAELEVGCVSGGGPARRRDEPQGSGDDEQATAGTDDVPEEDLGDPEGNNNGNNGNTGNNGNNGNDFDNGRSARASELDQLDELDREDAEFEREFGGAFGAPACGRDLVRYGAMVHEADIRLTGDGLVLVAIELVDERR